VSRDEKSDKRRVCTNIIITSLLLLVRKNQLN